MADDGSGRGEVEEEEPATIQPALNDDVLAHILSSRFMPAARAGRCRRVCRAWARAVDATSPFFVDARTALLDLSGCTTLDDATSAQLVRLLRRHPGTAHPGAPPLELALRLDACSRLSAGSAQLLARAASAHGAVRSLSLRGCLGLSRPALVGMLQAAGVARSSAGPGLRELCLADCRQIRGPLAEALGEFCPRLERLDVTGLAHLSPPARSPPPRVGAASEWRPVVHASCGYASLLGVLAPALRSLTLDRTGVGDEAVRKLCEAARDAKARPEGPPLPLTSLSLCGCGLTNGALQHLARATGSPAETAHLGPPTLSLRHLFLSDNLDLADESGVCALLCAPGMARLHTLALSGTDLPWRVPPPQFRHCPEPLGALPTGPLLPPPPPSLPSEIGAHQTLRRVHARECARLGAEAVLHMHAERARWRGHADGGVGRESAPSPGPSPGGSRASARGRHGGGAATTRAAEPEQEPLWPPLGIVADACAPSAAARDPAPRARAGCGAGCLAAGGERLPACAWPRDGVAMAALATTPSAAAGAPPPGASASAPEPRVVLPLPEPPLQPPAQLPAGTTPPAAERPAAELAGSAAELASAETPQSWEELADAVANGSGQGLLGVRAGDASALAPPARAGRAETPLPPAWDRPPSHQPTAPQSIFFISVGPPPSVAGAMASGSPAGAQPSSAAGVLAGAARDDEWAALGEARRQAARRPGDSPRAACVARAGSASASAQGAPGAPPPVSASPGAAASSTAAVRAEPGTGANRPAESSSGGRPRGASRGAGSRAGVDEAFYYGSRAHTTHLTGPKGLRL